MRISVFILAISLSTLAMAQTAAESLSQQLGHRANIEASFVQYILDASGSRLQETHGHMILAQPNRFWWKTEDPFAQLLVSNGKHLWVYDEDLEQVTVQKLDPRTTATPALLLSGNSQDIGAQFDVEMKRGTEGAAYYRLTPKDPESLYQTLRINFKNERLLGMQLEDALQQKTSLTFSNWVVNPKVDDALFEFVVPEGVDLVEMGTL